MSINRKYYLLLSIYLLINSLLFASEKTDYDVTKYGAKNDGITLSTKAIQKAIDECSNNGGGTVEFPRGTYLTGTMVIKDNVVLNLRAGSKILGSKNIKDYSLTPEQLAKKHRDIYGALIRAEGVKNIGITGFGIIDGQGESYLGKKDRPALIKFDNCKNVIVEGVKLQHPGAWTQHYFKCDGVTIRDVKIFAHGSENNDMIDINQSRNVVIIGVIGDSDDDGITLKSTGEGLVENVTISDCIIRTRTNAIKAGTESYGGFRNITITNCTISPSVTNGGISGFKEGMAGIALEIVDGGIMENITISNLVIEETTSPIFIRLGNRARNYPNLGLESKPIGKIDNINISNILAKNAGKIGCSIVGEIGHPIKNVTLSNIKINFDGGGTLTEGSAEKPELVNEYPECIRLGTLPAYGFFVRHVDGIVFRDVEFTYNDEEHRPAILFNDVQNLKLFNFDAQTAKDSKGQIVLQNTSNVFINGNSPKKSNIFLNIERNSKNINLVANNFINVNNPLVLDGTIKTEDLHVSANIRNGTYDGTTLFEFLQPVVSRDSLGMVSMYFPDNADIYYTTDGKKPEKSTNKYLKPFQQIDPTVIKAVAFKDGKVSSTATLQLERLQVLAPIISPRDQFFCKKIEVTLTSNTKGAKIYYTLDGSKPDKTSLEYQAPIIISKNSILRAIAFKDGYIPSKESASKYEVIKKTSGVQYKYYEKRFAKVPNFIYLKPVQTGVVKKFTLEGLENRGRDFGLVMHGFLNVKNSGEYTFYTATNDGSILFVDHKQVVNNDGLHGAIEKSGKIYLGKGEHLLELRYFQAGKGKEIKVFWEGPEIKKQEISANVFEN